MLGEHIEITELFYFNVLWLSLCRNLFLSHGGHFYLGGVRRENIWAVAQLRPGKYPRFIDNSALLWDSEVIFFFFSLTFNPEFSF